MKDNGEIERQLIAILGPERILKDSSKTKEYATGSMQVIFPGVSDHWRYAGDFGFDSNYWPDLVVLPDSTEQVSAILKLANEKSVPVVPWGGATNTYGSTLPIHGGIVVDLRKMDRIIGINKEELTVTAEAGITLLELQYLLNEEGLCHGTNPGSAPWATLGGAICCEAHTLAGFEFGTAVDNILALTVVLPDGDVIRTRSRYCGGYNLNQLFTRSEGTLGIVTEIKMRVSLMPEYTRNVGFVFDSFAETILTQNEILKNIFPYPGIVSAYDNANPLYSSLFQEKGEGMLLMTLEGIREVVDVEEKIIRNLIAKRHGTELAAGSADIVQDWWTLFMGGAMRRYEKASKGQLLPERVGPHIWIPRTHSIWSRNTFKDLAENSGIKYAGCINYPTRQSVAVTVDQSKPEEIAAYQKMIREFAVLVRRRAGALVVLTGAV